MNEAPPHPDLGPLVKEYPRSRAGLRKAVIVGAVSGVAAALLFWNAASARSVERTLSCIFGAVLSIFPLTAAYGLISRRGMSVRIHERGLVYQRPGVKLEAAWDEIAAFVIAKQNGEAVAFGRPLPPIASGEGRLEKTDGQSVYFSAMEGIDALADTVAERVGQERAAGISPGTRDRLRVRPGIGPPRGLERLREAERAKRLLLLGAVGVGYGAAWLIFAFHTTRIAESEGTVLRIYEEVHYTVTHVVDGVEHMANPGRIPDSLGRPPVGSRLRFYYYRSDPGLTFFEPRQHPWPGPIPAAVLILGLAALGESLRRRIRSRDADPAPSTPTRAPLEIRFAQRNWARNLFGGMFLVLGSVVVALSTWLGWTSGGDLGPGALVMVVGSHGLALAGLCGVYYSSGLVFDDARGLIYRWRGLPRPWFRRYWPLADLAGVETEMTQLRRARQYDLVLRFQDGTVWKHTIGYSLDQPSGTEERIKAYLEGGPPDLQ
jgi:hypothetical protein